MRFYGSVKGYGSTEGTRQGSQESGIKAHPRGWDLGVEVDGYAGNGDTDNFSIRISGGSHKSRKSIFVCEVTDLGKGWVRIATSEVFGGEVFYLNPQNVRFTRLPDDAPDDVRAKWLEG